MSKKITVALATYNGGAYLAPLLESLARQTYAPYELLVSDDNSTDDTLAIVRAFAKRAPFTVRILANKRRLGVIENFARAFEAASGELIAYCDQDDVWAAEKLAKCVLPFADSTVKLVIHRSEVVSADLEPLGYHMPESHEIEIGSVTFPSSFEMTYGLGHQMVFDIQIYRDYAWIFKQGIPALQAFADNYDNQIRFLAGVNGTIVSLNDVLVKFRRHQGATSDAGFVDNKDAVNSGFLSKSPHIYTEEAERFLALSSALQRHILPQMEQHHVKLSQYCGFLAKRAAIYHLRGKIYQNKPLCIRFGAYFSLLIRAAYVHKGQRGFGKRALLVDAFVAIWGLKMAKNFVALRSR